MARLPSPDGNVPPGIRRAAGQARAHGGKSCEIEMVPLPPPGGGNGVIDASI
jgi:hypothetical protein